MVVQKIEDEIRRQEEEKRRVTEEARRKKRGEIAKQKAAKQRRIEEERIQQIEAERKEEERLQQKREFNKKILNGALYFSPVALVAFLLFVINQERRLIAEAENRAYWENVKRENEEAHILGVKQQGRRE